MPTGREHREFERAGVATDLARVLGEVGLAARDLGGIARERQPTVAPLRHALEHVRRADAAEQHLRMRPLRWTRQADHRREVEILPVVLDILAGPQLLHHRDRFGGLRPAMREVTAEHRALGFVPTRADSVDEAPARVMIERRDLLRGVQRVALGHERDSGPELDRARGRSRARQPDERIGKFEQVFGRRRVRGLARIVVRRALRDHDVLRQPVRREAEGFRAFGDYGGIARGHVAEDLEDADFDVARAFGGHGSVLREGVVARNRADLAG